MVEEYQRRRSLIPIQRVNADGWLEPAPPMTDEAALALASLAITNTDKWYSRKDKSDA